MLLLYYINIVKVLKNNFLIVNTYTNFKENKHYKTNKNIRIKKYICLHFISHLLRMILVSIITFS